MHPGTAIDDSPEWTSQWERTYNACFLTMYRKVFARDEPPREFERRNLWPVRRATRIRFCVSYFTTAFSKSFWRSGPPSLVHLSLFPVRNSLEFFFLRAGLTPFYYLSVHEHVLRARLLIVRFDIVSLIVVVRFTKSNSHNSRNKNRPCINALADVITLPLLATRQFTVLRIIRTCTRTISECRSYDLFPSFTYVAHVV